MTGSLNMGTNGNITMSAGMTVDGVDISALSASSGNVTVTGSTAGYIPKFSSTTNIANSIMSESGTTVTAAGNISASRLISTVAIGTAPMTVTSTTKVTNLNADATDGFSLNQNVLTTSSPTYVAMTLTQATGTKPMTITSTTNVTNLNADYLDGYHSSSFVLSTSANTTTNIGTANTIPKYTASANIANSSLSDNGTWVVTTGALQATKFNSTVATGTAPLAVVSTTNVTSLNADYVDGFHLDQNVLTTSSPTFANITATANITMSSGMTVDGVDVSDHDARHKFQAADVLNIKDLYMTTGNGLQIDPLLLNLLGTKWTTGTGTTGATQLYAQCTTGTTSGSTSGQQGALWQWVAYSSGNPYLFRYFATMTSGGGATGIDMMEEWSGLIDYTHGSDHPLTTDSHVAFYFKSTGDGVAAKLYASNASGGTQTVTDTGVTAAADATVYTYIKYMASDIKFYVSTDGGDTWSLVATHTTNRPNGVGMIDIVAVNNGEAVDKQFTCGAQKFLAGGE
jgi:hypothetical protein